MTDQLARRYRNVSGTILVINDLNYYEIGINAVVDLSLFSEEILAKSRGLREHIALNNLIPDETNVKALTVTEDDITVKQAFNSDFIKAVASEVSHSLNQSKLNIDEIRNIAEVIAEQLAARINTNSSVSNTDILDKIDKLIQSNTTDVEQQKSNNEYERNIVESNIERIQDVLNKKYSQVQTKPPPANEENFNDGSEIIDELRDLLNESGGKKNVTSN